MKFLASVLLIVAVAVSCRKSDRDYDDSVSASTDQAMADFIVSNILLYVDEAARKQYGSIISYSSGYMTCAVVSENTGSSPNSILIDFGSSCSPTDGRIRSGKIYVSLSGNYLDSNTVATIHLIGFVIKGIEVEGSITLTNKGTSTNGNPYFRYTYKDMTFRNPDHPAWFSRLSATCNREMVGGNSTGKVSDDVYEITGNGSGLSRSGNTYSYKITDPLIVVNSCKYHVISGNMDLTPANLVTRDVDYGNSSCNKQVTVTIYDVQHTVTIP